MDAISSPLHVPNEPPPAPAVCSGASGGRAKSNSQRGKEFRAKRKSQLVRLETEITGLQEQISDLVIARNLFYQGRQLHTDRSCSTGAPARLIHEYFTRFKHGLRDELCSVGQKRSMSTFSVDQTSLQEQFLRNIFDQDAVVCGSRGPQASIDLWRRYTASHDGVWAEIVSIEATGCEDHVTVGLHSVMHGRISENTFSILFPGGLDRPDLQHILLGRDVAYSCVHQFAFSARSDQIVIEEVDMNFVHGLADAGVSLQDITVLMGSVAIVSSEQSSANTESKLYPPATKLSMSFLLSEAEAANEIGLGERIELSSS